MTRDQLNKCVLENKPVRFGNSKYYVLNIMTIANITLVYYAKDKGEKIGRVRCMDLVTFTKWYEV